MPSSQTSSLLFLNLIKSFSLVSLNELHMLIIQNSPLK